MITEGTSVRMLVMGLYILFRRTLVNTREQLHTVHQLIIIEFAAQCERTSGTRTVIKLE